MRWVGFGVGFSDGVGGSFDWGVFLGWFWKRCLG